MHTADAEFPVLSTVLVTLILETDAHEYDVCRGFLSNFSPFLAQTLESGPLFVQSHSTCSACARITEKPGLSGEMWMHE